MKKKIITMPKSRIKAVKIGDVSLLQLFPSIITMFALCLGSTALKCALEGRFEAAATLIIIAAVLDILDGKVARLLNSTSNFGAQLDSLADLVNFGVAPSFLMYLWSLKTLHYQALGWGVVLFYITCSAFRLARFNVQSSSDEDQIRGFKGVPMPGGAGLAILPLLMTFHITEYQLPSSLLAIYIVFVAILMISRIPTLAIKNVKVRKDNVLLVMTIAGVITAGIIIEPWIVLPIIGVLYIISILGGAIYSQINLKKNKQQAKISS